MKFYNNFIRTFADFPNHTTLLIHSLAGCPLKCFGCHNYDEIIAHTPKIYKTPEDLYTYLQQSGFLFDAVMFSGGEFLISPLEKIKKLLAHVRQYFSGKIIITTSGMYPKKIRTLYENDLADGIHIDMKLPYHALDIKEDAEIYQQIMGITPTQKIVENLLDSIDTVLAHNSPNDQVRTVKYPLLDEAFFLEIERYLKEQKSYLNSQVDYFLNDFMPPPA